MSKAERMREIAEYEQANTNQMTVSIKAILSYIKKQAKQGRTECHYTMSKSEIEALQEQDFKVDIISQDEPDYAKCKISW